MAHRILAPAAELAAIHAAVCRARRAGLACSTCSDLAERAARCAGQLREAA
jgi:hypothetical protein